MTSRERRRGSTKRRRREVGRPATRACQARETELAMGDSNAARPDLAQGIPADSVAENGMLLGRVGDDEVLLARAGGELFAVGSHCTHYHGALADGLLVGDTVRCPLHHACFSLRTGEA